MKPIRLMLARFPFGRKEDPDICDWVTTTVITARHDPRIFEIIRWRKDDTPITMGRNACFEAAKKQGVDFIMMVDSDMSPDVHLPSNPYHQLPADPTAKPFFDTTLEFLWQQRKAGIPSVVGAPYCGPPPIENVYVFRWATYGNSPHDEPDVRLEQYSREEAATLKGIQECAALPTGLIMFDVDCLERLDAPYTYYEWGDQAESIKASTEDVTLTRDMSLGGCPQFCNWDAWAGHWKNKCVSKPLLLTTKMVGDKFKRLVMKDLGIPYESNPIPQKSNEGFIKVAPAPAQHAALLVGDADAGGPGETGAGQPGPVAGRRAELPGRQEPPQ